jgi:hypothetical protein
LAVISGNVSHSIGDSILGEIQRRAVPPSLSAILREQIVPFPLLDTQIGRLRATDILTLFVVGRHVLDHVSDLLLFIAGGIEQILAGKIVVADGRTKGLHVQKFVLQHDVVEAVVSDQSRGTHEEVGLGTAQRRHTQRGAAHQVHHGIVVDHVVVLLALVERRLLAADILLQHL